MENIILYLAAALIAVLILTVWTNLVVAVTKKAVAWDKFPTQVWVLIVALVSTFLAAAVLAAAFSVVMYWYYWVAVLALAVLVAYAAMFGYDNLYNEVMATIKKIKDIMAGTK